MRPRSRRDAQRDEAVYCMTPSPLTMPPTPVLNPAILRTPTEPNGNAAVLRFRERVRARSGTAELLAFRAGGERFAFDVRALDEAVDAPPLERSPLALAPRTMRASMSRAESSAASRTAPTADEIFRGIARLGERSIPVFDTARLARHHRRRHGNAAAGDAQRGASHRTPGRRSRRCRGHRPGNDKAVAGRRRR